MVLDASLLNSQYYKVQIKDKWIKPGKGVVPSPTSWCCSSRKWSLCVTLNYCQQTDIYIYISVSQKFCNIFVTEGTIQQPSGWFLSKSWRWWTTQVRYQAHLILTVVLIAGFMSLSWSTALKSTVLSLPGFAWSWIFLKFKWNFLNHLVTVLWSIVSSLLA